MAKNIDKIKFAESENAIIKNEKGEVVTLAPFHGDNSVRCYSLTTGTEYYSPVEKQELTFDGKPFEEWLLDDTITIDSQ